MRLLVSPLLLLLIIAPRAGAQPAPAQFGGTYAKLDARRQHLVDNWVARFNSVTGQKVEAGPFYDDIIAFSTKTTFEAVTNALMQSSLTDANGASLGDALSLVERVDTVHGKIPGERGDHQFRMYVHLTPTATTRFADRVSSCATPTTPTITRATRRTIANGEARRRFRSRSRLTIAARTSTSTTDRRAFRPPCSTAT